MQVNLHDLEKLDREDIPNEEKQEIMYSILKEQLKKQRKEILKYRQMKKEQERNKWD